MSRARLIAGVVIVTCTLAASTSVVSAAAKAKPAKPAKPAPAAAVTLGSSPPASLQCKKGQTYQLHGVGTNKLKWICAKAA